MKRFWKDTLAAIALAYLAGTALAQQVPMGLPPGPANNPPQSVIPAPTPPPTPATPTTQAPPLANTPSIPTSTPVAAQGVGDKKIGSAKTDPPPECCPPICCPAPRPICCPAPSPICCPAPSPAVCQDNLITEDHDCHRKWHWEVGAGIYYIQPNFTSNPAHLTRRTDPVTGNVFNRETDFRYRMNVAPLAWIGATSDCGFGIRARWFEFNQGASESFTADANTRYAQVNAYGLGTAGAFGAPGDTITSTSNLRVDVWDLELTQSFTCCQWNVLLGGGVRYANMQQRFQQVSTALRGDPGFQTTLINDLVGSHTFNGAGPSLALEGRRHLGHGGFAVYGNARGSVLFGSASAVGQTTTTITPPGQQPIVGLTTQNASSQADVLPIGEVEVGVEYTRDCGKAHLFVQAGFVGQVWFGAGNAALVDLGGQTTNNNANFGFVGATLRAGVAY